MRHKLILSDEPSDIKCQQLMNPISAQVPVGCSAYVISDIFAPGAANVASGIRLETLGDALNHLIVLNIPQPSDSNDVIEGIIVHVDRFGNLISNIPNMPQFSG